MFSSNSSFVNGNERLLKQLSKYTKSDNPLKLIHVECSFSTNPLIIKYSARLSKVFLVCVTSQNQCLCVLTC